MNLILTIFFSSFALVFGIPTVPLSLLGGTAPAACHCKPWELLAKCIETTGNSSLDSWLKSHGVSDADDFHTCVSNVIKAAPEPTNLIGALVLVQQIIACGTWHANSFWEDYPSYGNDPFWAICAGIVGSGSSSASSASGSASSTVSQSNLCGQQAPIAQQASQSPSSFPFNYNLTATNTYTCQNLTTVHLSGGCGVCNQTTGPSLCASACKYIYGGAYRNSSCNLGTYPNYPTLQSCDCNICALGVCPDQATELSSQCFSYQPSLVNSASYVNTACQTNVNPIYHLPQVQTQAQWNALTQFLALPAVGYPKGAPFWLGLNRNSNTSTWSWYNNGTSIAANSNSDYAFAGGLLASKQFDGQIGHFNITAGQSASCQSSFCAQGVAATSSGGTYQLWDDIDWQPTDQSILSICHSVSQPPYSVDLWTAAYGQPWSPPTTTTSSQSAAVPAAPAPSSTPYCAVSSSTTGGDINTFAFWNCWGISFWPGKKH